MTSATDYVFTRDYLDNNRYVAYRMELTYLLGALDG